MLDKMNDKDNSKLYRPLVRVRDNNNYEFDREEFIASLEKKLNVNISTIPDWQQLIKRLEVSSTYYKVKLQEAEQRKRCIIEKLHNEYNKWPDSGCAQQKFDVKLKSLRKIPASATTDQLELDESAHPNSLVGSNVGEEENGHEDQIKKTSEGPLPTVNGKPLKSTITLHPLISPARSVPTVLSFAQKRLRIQPAEILPDKISLEKQNPVLITFSPTFILIDNDTLNEQILKFSITNTATHIVYLRFVNISDKTHFKTAKVKPFTDVQLPPGLSRTFKFIIRLENNRDDFETSILFDVGCIRSAQSHKYSQQIAVIGKLTLERSIRVTRLIDFGSNYYWKFHQDKEQTEKYVTVRVQSNYGFHLHVDKLAVDYLSAGKVGEKVERVAPEEEETEHVSGSSKTTVTDEDDSIKSLVVVKKELKRKSLVIKPPPPSAKQAKPQHPKTGVKVKNTTVAIAEMSVGHIEIRSNIIDFILKALFVRSTSPYLFEFEYALIKPNTTLKIPVSFKLHEYIGPHQAFYDFKFYDEVTGELLVRKTVRIFADVVAHPLKISPPILDIRDAIVNFGLYRKKFIITNTNKLKPMLITIQIDSVVGKLIHIDPVSVTVPQNSSVDIYLNHCSSESYDATAKSVLYFVIRISCTGVRGILIPDLFYEIIAPFNFEYSRLVTEELGLTEEEGLLIEDMKHDRDRRDNNMIFMKESKVPTRPDK